MFPGYKSSAGMPPRAARPVPDRRGGDRGARARPLADGRVRGRRRDRRGVRPVRRRPGRRAGPRSARPTRTWPSSCATSGSSCCDRRRRITYDEPAVMEKWGVAPTAIPDWLALVGDSSDGYPGLPGWGARPPRPCSRVRLDSRRSRPRRPRGRSRASRGAPWPRRDPPRALGRGARCIATLARLRTIEDGVDIPQQDPSRSCEWRARRATTWEAFCDRVGPRRGCATRPAPLGGVGRAASAAALAGQAQQLRVVRRRAPRGRRSSAVGARRSNHGRRRVGEVAPARSAMRPGRRDVPRREPALPG